MKACVIVIALFLQTVALKSFVTCLETSQSTDSGCPLSKSNADMITHDVYRFGCASSFTGACNCQASFWATYTVLGDTTNLCRARKSELSCLGIMVGPGCDGTTAKDAIATKVDTARKSIPYCQDVTDTCECEIEMAKTDLSTDLCQAYFKEMGCLATASSFACDGITVKGLIGAFMKKSLSGSCSPTDTCGCEIEAAWSNTTNYLTRCNVLDTLYTCVNDVDCRSNRDCSGENNRDDRMEEIRSVQKSSLCWSSGVQQLNGAWFLPTAVALLTIGLTNK